MDIELTISGNLTSDPQLKHTKSGTPVCEFRVLVNRRPAMVDGERVELSPRAFNIVAFGDMGVRAAESLRKGDRVIVRASDVYSEAWSHRDNGRPMSVVKVRAADIALSLRWRGATSTPAETVDQGDEPQPAPEQPEVPEVLAGLTG